MANFDRVRIVLLLCVFAVGIVISIGDFRVLQGASALSLAIAETGVPDEFLIATTSGLHASGDVRGGDRVRGLEPLTALRFGAFSYPARAKVFDLRTHREVVLSDQDDGRPFEFRLRQFVRFLVEIAAFVLLLLRGREKGVVPLCVFLFFSQYSISAFSGFWIGPMGAIAYELIQSPLNCLAAGALINFAAQLVPSNRTVRILTTIGYLATLALGILLSAISAATFINGTQWDLDNTLSQLGFAGLTCIALAIFSVEAFATRASDRRRVVISAVATLIGSTTALYSLFGGPRIYDALESNIVTASTVVMVIGLIYGIVVERLFDIAFVVNRAFVYAVTSAFVVLAFVAIEWLVGRTASSYGHVQGAALELGLAIMVALSLRPIHDRVDRLVDSVIFAARHRSSTALLRFAEDCGEFHEAHALLETTLTTLRMYARVSASAIFLADETGDLHAAYADGITVSTLGRDEAVVVRLRTSRAPIERHSYAHLTVADVAFPMMRRRALIGALLCSLPPHAEPYSPEEFSALATIAREVGGSLVALEAAMAQRLTIEVAELRSRLAVDA